MKQEHSNPLPAELLPKSSLVGDSALWENRVQNLMTAASPILAQYKRVPTPWWSIMAARFQVRLAVMAAAAALATIAVHLSVPVPSRQDRSLPALIADGNAATALLPIADAETDPVLALVILEGNTP